MRPASLALRGLAYHARSHAAVVLGVACAVAVLGGALLVGDSVRASLRELFLARLGRADHALSSPGFFREALAGDLERHPGFAEAFADLAPLVAVEGVVSHATSGRRAARVAVYGVDERFWRFHGVALPEAGMRDALVSAPLAWELRAQPGDALLVRVERAGDVPGASLFGRKDAPGAALRVGLARVLARDELGEFSLRASQQPVLALFLPLRLLQRTLGREDRVNTLLLAESRDAESPARRSSEAGALVRQAARLEDIGLRLRPLSERGALSLESDSGLLSDPLAAAARAAADRLGYHRAGFLSYLANSIEIGGRAIPYSMVTALDPGRAPLPGSERLSAGARPGVLLNEWAATDLGAVPGDTVRFEYFVWLEEGRLETRSAEFELRGSLPLAGAMADPDLTPSYPGITDSAHLADWDPPFPVDLRRIRSRDEEYWERHRTTPKAFLALSEGQRLWRHRLGGLTSIRAYPTGGTSLAAAERAWRAELARELDPLASGLRIEAVRESGIAASRGATDFAEYFAYFSAFLVAAALLLTGLFFRLGLEQRLRELGVLRAIGFPATRVWRLFLAEGLVLALLGSLLGLLGAWAYGGLMMLGLTTWWSDAVGTQDLRLHVTASALLAGGLAGVVTSGLVILATLRGLRRVSPRALLAGTRDEPGRRERTGGRATRLALGALALAAALLAAAGAGTLDQTPAFFGAGTLLLVAALAAQWRWLGERGGAAPGAGVLWLSLRNAAHRPGRSLLCIALIAFATFVIVSVGAFRRGEAPSGGVRDSGTGGYALLAESLVPLHHDPATPVGREALGVPEAPLEGISLARFRLRPGEDASCLNLYRPQDPRVLGVTPEFVREGRFAFQASLARTPEERANPWLLLERGEPDGSIPAIVDANSLAYVLHRRLGDELALASPGAAPLRLRLVGALRDSLFQGELLIAESRFLEAFPRLDGYRVFLLDVPAGRADELAGVLEERLGDLGFDVVDAAARLAGYHRVENAYLATFETLGGLGLLLGTLGLATVLLRNALERRRELALLRAVGYRPDQLTLLVTGENVLLLLLGLATGTACALVAIAPALVARGGSFPVASLLGLLGAVLIAGLAASRLAAALVRRAPLLAALRSE